MTVHFALRHGALGASAVVVATLLLAAGCSAPPGSGTDTGDDVPEFAGNLGFPGNGSPGNGSPGVGAPGASSGAGIASGNTNAPAPASGAGGSANTSAGEQTAGSSIGLQPAPSNANAGQSSGAGGSSMAGAEPGTNTGAAGSSFDPVATGSAGSTSMPPPANPPPDPPAQNPTPSNPPPAPAAPPNADCGTAFFCDDFEGVAEGASPSAALWRVVDGYGLADRSANVQVSGDNAHGGAQAVRVAASGSRNGIRATLPATRYFVRAWLQIDSAPLGPVFIGLGTDQNSETRLRIQGRSFATINTVGPGDAVRPGSANSGNCPECVTLTPNEWFCAEIFIDDAAQNATLWIDGVEAASIVSGQGGWPVQPDNPFLFLGSMGVQGGMTGVWIDDVAAGPSRLGCD